MRIEKNGVYADVTEDVAAQLIKDRGWKASSVKSSGPARFVSPEELEAITTKAAKLVATGGYEAPPNIGWTATVLADTNYIGLVEYRCINGIVQWRGSLKGAVSASGSYKKVRSFTAVNIPLYAPKLEVNTTAFAVDTGTTYRIAAVRFGTDGGVSLSAPTGKFDSVNFDGISYPAF